MEAKEKTLIWTDYKLINRTTFHSKVWLLKTIFFDQYKKVWLLKLKKAKNRVWMNIGKFISAKINFNPMWRHIRQAMFLTMRWQQTVFVNHFLDQHMGFGINLLKLLGQRASSLEAFTLWCHRNTQTQIEPKKV